VKAGDRVEENSRYYQELEHLARGASISEKEWMLFVHGTRVRRVDKGVCIIRAGEYVDCAYYCVKGLFRFCYTLSDGREYNKGFALEQDFFTSYGAMISREPSYFSVEALEEAVVIEIPYSLLEALMDQSHSWERFVRRNVEKLYLKKEERERQLLFLSARERYEQFRAKYPGLDERLPQYHIASYLGITPVSLSRLLNQGKN
jgi:CRP-like cAMP-binding protein